MGREMVEEGEGWARERVGRGRWEGTVQF